MPERRIWLMKTEPSSYALSDLARDRRTFWSGVRNYQARNFMRDTMRVGDRILFYHSNAEPPGVAGLARICGEGRPDATARDPKDHHFDPAATAEKPIWYGVDVAFVKAFRCLVPLDALRADPALKDMVLLQRSRLSVQPVKERHFNRILEMAGA